MHISQPCIRRKTGWLSALTPTLYSKKVSDWLKCALGHFRAHPYEQPPKSLLTVNTSLHLELSGCIPSVQSLTGSHLHLTKCYCVYSRSERKTPKLWGCSSVVNFMASLSSKQKCGFFSAAAKQSRSKWPVRAHHPLRFTSLYWSNNGESGVCSRWRRRTEWQSRGTADADVERMKAFWFTRVKKRKKKRKKKMWQTKTYTYAITTNIVPRTCYRGIIVPADLDMVTSLT